MHSRTTLAFSAAVVALVATVIILLPTPSRSPAPATGGTAKSGSSGSSISSLFINNVRFFDGERTRGPATLVLRGGRVDSILAADAPLPPEATLIDGEGLTALPGLFDAHVHVFGPARRDALRFGVTTVIDMFTEPTNLAGKNEQRESFLPQRSAALFSAGMLATVDGGHGTQFGVDVHTLTSPDEAPAWVAARLAEGSDFIKLVYMPRARQIPSLDLATASALIDAAHEAGVMAVAHIATLASAKELLDAGIDGLVHVFADEEVDDSFLERARTSGLFVIPTLSVIATADGRSTGPALAEDPDLGPHLSGMGRTSLRRVFPSVSPVFSLDTALLNVRRMHEAGIPILAGSDAPNPGTTHGASLHGELALLVRAGLAPEQALAAATSVPARVFAATDRGRIAPGARADLVLVDGDPADSILDTRALRHVLRNGHPVDIDGDDGQADGASDTLALELPARLGRFDQSISAAPGFTWAETTDGMMGGTSTARLSHVPREADAGGALAVDATVTDGFPYPWAGAYFGVSRQSDFADLSDVRSIAFDVRGTPATYRLMMFSGNSLGAPPTVEFEAGDAWRRVEIPLERFSAFAAERFSGMAFVTPMSAGNYRFTIDEVELLRHQP